MRKTVTILALLALSLTGCGGGEEAEPVDEPTQETGGAEGEGDASTGMSNPASVHCEEQGGTEETRQDAEGDSGVCVFPDGSECESWAYFREECAPGDNPGA